MPDFRDELIPKKQPLEVVCWPTLNLPMVANMVDFEHDQARSTKFVGWRRAALRLSCGLLLPGLFLLGVSVQTDAALGQRSAADAIRAAPTATAFIATSARRAAMVVAKRVAGRA
jgi:hypothetical protein